MAFDFVAPFAGWLRRTLPAIRLEVLSTTQYLDLARREADLAIRVRAPTQGDLVGAGAIFLARLRHRFSRKSVLERVDVARVRAVADLIAKELRDAAPIPSRRTQKTPSRRR